MGALGELLRTSTNELEVRRAATTIISRHRADLRASRGTASSGTASSGTASSGTASSGTASSGTASSGTASSGTALLGGDSSVSRATNPPSDQRNIHREAVEVHSRGSPRSGIPGTSTQIPSHPNGVQVLLTSESTSPTHTQDPRGSEPASPSTSHSSTSASSPLSTQNSAPSTSPIDPLLQLKLIADSLRLRNEPVPREPHSAKSILNRAGATTAMSRDRPR
jgi:hypothetical protein